MHPSPSDQKITHSTSQRQILLQQNSLLLNTTLSQLKRHNHDQQVHTQRLSMNNNMTTFKEIQEYRKISQNLQLMDKLKKVNSQKLKKLEKNVSNLDFLHRLSFKETLKLQHKKSKLEETQSMALFLHNLKQRNFQYNQQKQVQRKQLCLSLRQSAIHNRSFSHSIHSLIKQQRVKQFKQANSKLLQSHQRNLQDLLESNRRKAHETRMSQLRLKEKLKKYEEYKIYVGRMNYEKKLQNEYRSHLENRRYLRQVETKLKEEDKLFRKTEKLKKESKKIEDFYLTGTGTE